ncbi:MAG: pentapeptide repeat-containing protein [Pseudomonadota bacterium]
MRTKLDRARQWTRIALQTVTGDLVGAYDSIDQALVERRNPEASIETRHSILWQNVLSLTLEEFLRTTRFDFVNEEEAARGAHAFLAPLLAEREEDFSAETIETPISYGRYQKLRKGFPKFLKQLDPERRVAPKRDRADLDHAFERAFDREWMADHAFYEPILAALSGPQSTAARRRRQWAAHNDWLRRRFARIPIWGQEETGITLADLYVAPRAFHRHDLKKDGAGRGYGAEEKAERRAEVVDLRTAVTDWLASDDRRDALRIVSGGPGSGKSSFARAFSAGLADDPGWRVLFVEVQGMGKITDLEARIGEVLRARIADGFEENPLSWLPFQDDRRLLMVFDGLDELAEPGEEDRELMRRLINGIQGLLRDKNGDKLRVKALLLGRPVSTENAMREAGLPIEKLWEVAKMTPLTADDARVDDEHFSADETLAGDLRPAYWENWCKASGQNSAETCPLQDDGFGELTSEPILNYLLILSGFLEEGADRQAVTENINVLYDRILERVLPRDWGTDAHPSTKGLTPNDFFFLLECLGLAAWSSGGRVGSEDEFRCIRDLCARRADRERYQSLPSAELRNVAMSFFTRAEGGFEFSHKSFSDYLVARGLMRFVITQLKPSAEFGEQDALAAWLSLTSAGPLTEEIIEYLRGEARLLDEAALRDLKPLLERLLSTVIHDGITAEQPDAATWRDKERSQCRAECSLLAVLNAVFFASREKLGSTEHVLIDWRQDSVAARRFLHRLYFDGDVSHIGAQCLAGIAFSFEIEGKPEVSFLYNAFLPSADLRWCNFEHCSLIGANFFDAQLTETKFDNASLKRAHFAHTNVKKSSFRNANVEEANFSYVRGETTVLSDEQLKKIKKIV